jgi:hypothetical protein
MNLVERVKKLLVSPPKEWAVIATEQSSVVGLYTQYVMILAASPAIGTFIGFSIVGYSGLGSGPAYRIPIAAGVAAMVINYLLTLGGVYAMALVIDGLAPKFAGDQDFMQAFKVAAYFPTASWVAGVFSIFPELAVIGILASLYSLWLLYTGLGMLMKVPEDKSIAYTAVVVLVAIVIMIAISIVAALAMPARTRGF